MKHRFTLSIELYVDDDTYWPESNGQPEEVGDIETHVTNMFHFARQSFESVHGVDFVEATARYQGAMDLDYCGNISEEPEDV